MWKFIVGVSTIIMAVALGASGFEIQSAFDVASAEDNMYIQKKNCTPSGTGFFYNIGGCTTSGSSCTLKKGTTVNSTLRFIPNVTRTNYLITHQVTWRPGGIRVTDITKQLNGTFPANQIVSVTTPLDIRSSFSDDYDVDTKVVPVEAPGTTMMCCSVIFVTQ